MPPSIRIIVGIHSHIDTEWYWPYAVTTQWATEIVTTALRHLATDPDYHFSQDQVTVWGPVWARLTAEQRELVRNAIRTGRVEPLLGFYTACEVAEPAGESLVRQIIYGQRWMETVLGQSAIVAWLIDQFGQIPQLPQILVLAGYKGYVFGRDIPPDYPIDTLPADFWCVGPDGTRIQTHWLPAMYSVGVHNVRERLARIRQHSKHSVWFLPWGGDVVLPEARDIVRAQVEEAARELGLFATVELGTPSTYFAAVRELPEDLPDIALDFNPPQRIQDLRGTYDNRSALKVAHRRVEQRLLSVEALLVHAGVAAGDRAYLDRLWTHLLMTQFHDTIGGSCTDPVYERALQRLATIEQDLSTIQAEALTRLQSVPADGVIVFNPLDVERDEVVAILPPDPISDWTLVDEQGQPVHAAQDAPAEPVRALVHLGPWGSRVMHFVRDDRPYGPEITRTVTTVGWHGQTDRYTWTLAPSGLLTELVHRPTGRYLWSPETESGNTLSLWREDDPDMEGPLHLTGEREAIHSPPIDMNVRCDKLGVRMAITWAQWGGRIRQEWTFVQGHDRIDCVVQLDDCALPDGLLVVGFPVSADVRRAVHYETPFADTQRPSGHFAAQTYVAVEHDRQGLAVMNRGTPGYWVSDAAVHLVLLRVFGNYKGYWDLAHGMHHGPRGLNRSHPLGDFAGAATQTELARERTSHRFEYALLPYETGWMAADVARVGLAYNRPFLTRYGVASPITTGDAEPLVRLKGLSVVVDGLKPAEDGAGAILRIHEPYGQAGDVILQLSSKVAAVEPVDLRERSIGPRQSGMSLVYGMRPFQIMSWRLLLENHGS